MFICPLALSRLTRICALLPGGCEEKAPRVSSGFCFAVHPLPCLIPATLAGQEEQKPGGAGFAVNKTGQPVQDCSGHGEIETVGDATVLAIRDVRFCNTSWTPFWSIYRSGHGQLNHHKMLGQTMRVNPEPQSKYCQKLRFQAKDKLTNGRLVHFPLVG